MRAFEDYLLGKKNEGGRKSTNSSFVNRAYDNKGMDKVFIILKLNKKRHKNILLLKELMQKVLYLKCQKIMNI